MIMDTLPIEKIINSQLKAIEHKLNYIAKLHNQIASSEESLKGDKENLCELLKIFHDVEYDDEYKINETFLKYNSFQNADGDLKLYGIVTFRLFSFDSKNVLYACFFNRKNKLLRQINVPYSVFKTLEKVYND